MSITLGIYDLFSYAIPGMLYLYVVNEIIKLIGWQYIDITQLSQGGNAAPSVVAVFLLTVGSYVTGHMFEGLRSALTDKWLYYYGAPDRVLARINNRFSQSDLEIGFHGDEWSICMEVLQVRSHETIQESERLKATGLMMRNLSFGAFLFAVFRLIQFFLNTNNFQYLIVSAIAVVAMIIAHQRAKRFDEWSYGNVFLQALAYGSNLQEFLENDKPAWNAEKNIPKQNKKSKERN